MKPILTIARRVLIICSVVVIYSLLMLRVVQINEASKQLTTSNRDLHARLDKAMQRLQHCGAGATVR